MLKRISPALCVLVLSTAASAQMPTAAVEALDGIDPVVLIQQGKEVFGKGDLSVERGRFRYLFSSPDTKAIFESEPAKYEIQLGGACARMGGGAMGNPSDYFVHDGKIYIFGSDDCRKRFAAAPDKFLPKPAPAFPTSAAAAAEGRKILARAVTAMGGAAVLDKITAYAETVTQIQKRPGGDVPVTSRTIWRFPGEARIERTMELPSGQRTFATVMTPGAAWNLVQSRVFPVPETGRESLELGLGRHPLAILKARQEKGFKAAALPAATLEGTAVQRVRVRHGGLDATLAIDAASGRVHSVEFRDRNIDSERGVYTVFYSDFRESGGVLLPHTARALFDGQPDAFQSWTVKAAEVNPKIDPALFVRPAEAAR